jgi:Raf kinase inhibitor-like YbhB/YbcL family protein
MKLWSTGWQNGEPIPERYAAGRLSGNGVAFSDNLSPPLAWSDLPAGTQSLVLICHDFDMPDSRDGVNQPDRELPVDLPRHDFFHWLLADLTPHLSGLAEGDGGRGFTPRGKPAAAVHGARQGLNDCSGWFADDAALAGQYRGYDGPFPPSNDSLVHHYLFTLYALSVARLPVADDFSGAQLREALAGRVLDAATLSGTYTLNRRLRGA